MSFKDLELQNRPLRNLTRIIRYVLSRGILLFLTVAATVYLMILIANLGGYLDEAVKADIDFGIGMSMKDVPGTTEERAEIFEERTEAAYKAAGLNTPFIIRCFRWLGRGLTLDWGETNLQAYSWSRQTNPIRDVILQNLPRSLLIFGTANLLLFLTTILIALPLTNSRAGWLDNLIIVLTPLSSAPAWVYGIVLNFVFIKLVGGVFAGGTFDAWPEEFKFSHIPILLKHLMVPTLAIFLSGFFQGIYSWRTFFRLYAREDYVELAKAKGLRTGLLRRRHILRPLLPALITSFVLLFVSLWQEVIVLEQFFNIAGIGRLFVTAIQSYRIPVIVAIITTFAYLLAITVLLLDIVYAIVDPRINVGNQNVRIKTARRRPWLRRLWQRLRRSSRSGTEEDTGEEGIPYSGTEEAEHAPQSAGHHGTSGWKEGWIRVRERIGLALKRLAHYPAAIVGLLIILGMIALSIYTLIAIPYPEMLKLWREDDENWIYNPKDAAPTWVNLVRKRDLPSSYIMDSRDIEGTAQKTRTPVSEDMTEITFSFPFDYPYGAFPQDLAVFVDAEFDEKRPLITLTWLTPDGREIEVMSASIQNSYTYWLSQDDTLGRKMDTQEPLVALLSQPGSNDAIPLKGTHELRLSAYVFEEESDVEATIVLYGQVYGLAGTDERRRDLKVPLLWGMPVALAFGILAALGTSLSSITIAAVGTWFGGWLDALVQRITEVNMILPFLPVSIMVFTIYSKSFWVILGVTVLLSIFGNAIKNYRALFLQVREAPYVEAALSYGASNWRIISRYLIPRIISVLVPQLIIMVPSYVFLEATLAFLGVSDPVLPTWGKLIVSGFARGIYTAKYHLVFEPLGLLMLVGIAFVMVGLSLERLFNVDRVDR